jgi:hypothetical protein
MADEERAHPPNRIDCGVRRAKTNLTHNVQKKSVTIIPVYATLCCHNTGCARAHFRASTAESTLFADVIRNFKHRIGRGCRVALGALHTAAL